MDKFRKHPVIVCWLIFMICAAARIVEYFFIRTDESFLSENFIHKLFGIFLLFIILPISKMKWKDIGFVNEYAIGNCGKGILLGSVCFAVAYGIECLILYITNQNVELEFYASGFSLSGETEKQTGVFFVLICIVFNMINVWMEEGVFRGIFAKFLESISYIKAVFFIAFLFGVWHWVVKAINSLERRFGKLFYKLFKSITVDNGCEFQDFEGIEAAHRRKGKRTIVFFCHPYSAFERGSNENMNRLIRRFFPKGTSFDTVKPEEVRAAERWVNNYPRKLLGWKSAAMLFEKELLSA